MPKVITIGQYKDFINDPLKEEYEYKIVKYFYNEDINKLSVEEVQERLEETKKILESKDIVSSFEINGRTFVLKADHKSMNFYDYIQITKCLTNINEGNNINTLIRLMYREKITTTKTKNILGIFKYTTKEVKVLEDSFPEIHDVVDIRIFLGISSFFLTIYQIYVNHFQDFSNLLITKEEHQKILHLLQGSTEH